MFIQPLEALSRTNGVGHFFTLMQYYRSQFHPDSKEIPSEILKGVYYYADNFSSHIINTIEPLTKFLNVGIEDTNIGIVGDYEISSMSYHLGFLAKLSANLLDIKEDARATLEARGESCKL